MMRFGPHLTHSPRGVPARRWRGEQGIYRCTAYQAEAPNGEARQAVRPGDTTYAEHRDDTLRALLMQTAVIP